MIKEKDKNIISISEYIKALFLSLLEIEELKNSFLNKNLFLPKNDSLSNLLYNLISYYNNKKQNQKNSLLKIIDDIEKKIKVLNKDISTNINFKYIIDFVLTTLDNELNNYKNEMEEFDYEDFDQSLVYRKFQYFYKNNSIIQNLFYYHLEINTLYSCCGLNKYICKLCKYINLDIDSKEKVSLNDLIHYWANKQTTVEKFCQMCNLKNQKTLVKNRLIKYPEILIIILNNKNNCKINITQTIKLNDYEYNIIVGIIKTEKENSFDIIFYNNSKLTIIKEGKIKEKDKKYNPYVFFCKKGKEIKKNIEDNKNEERYMSDKKQEKYKKKNGLKTNNNKPTNNNNTNNKAQNNNINNNIQNNNMMNNNPQINNMDNNIQNNNMMNNMAQINNMNNNIQNNNMMNNMAQNSNNNFNNIINLDQLNMNFMNNLENNQMNNGNYNNNINNINNNNFNINLYNNNNINNNINNNNYNNNFNNNINSNNNNIIQNFRISNYTNNNPQNSSNNNYNNNPSNFSNNNYNNFSQMNNNNTNNIVSPQYYRDNNFNNPNQMNNNNANNNFKAQNVLFNNSNDNNINNNAIDNNIPFSNQNIMNNYNINNNINNSNIPISNPVNANNDNLKNETTLSKNENEFVLYFNFSNGKQLYLNVNKFLIFNQVIIELKNKYSWMNGLKIKNFSFNKKILDYNKSVKDNGLSDLSEIDIIEEDT